MKTWMRFAMVAALSTGGTMVVSAQEAAPAQSAAVAQVPADNMTPYRMMAADTLAAFKAHDLATAKKKARELEVAWDSHERALQKQSPGVWSQIDSAMDAFIKPLGKSPDLAKVQAAYDTYIAKLQLAVKN
jgi:hypothetical protein